MTGPFLSALQDVSRGQVALVTPDEEIFIEDLCADALELRNSFHAQSPSMVVTKRNIHDFIKLLLAMDGTYRGFHIVPHGSQPHPNWETLTRAQYAGSGENLGTSWFISTSGTTGHPKLIEHSFESLTSSTKPKQQGSSYRRWGLLYDHSRFAGLQVLLQALLAGDTLCAAPLDDLAGALKFYDECAITSLSATPTVWRKILMFPSVDLPSLRQITLGGEIADQSLLDALARKFRDCSIRHIYASTEAGVGFSVSDGKAGFPASYLVNGHQLGIQLLINENSHLLVKRNDNCSVPTLSKAQENAESGFMDTGDLVRRAGDRIFFLGRENGSINVGGNKVHPEAIEHLLCSHEGVAAARVYAVSSSMIGNLVAADIVPHGEFNSCLLEDIRALCKSNLLPWQRPVKFNLVESVHVSSAGKIERTNP